jgi:hypothetical protein
MRKVDFVTLLVAFAASMALFFFGQMGSIHGLATWMCPTQGQRPTITIQGVTCLPCPSGQYQGSRVRLLLPSLPALQLPGIEMCGCEPANPFRRMRCAESVRSGRSPSEPGTRNACHAPQARRPNRHAVLPHKPNSCRICTANSACQLENSL